MIRVKIKRLLLVISCGVLLVLGYGYYPKYRDYMKWHGYFSRTSIGAPNALVSEYFDNAKRVSPLTVLDLGAGNGSDTKYLLDKNHIVYSVDFYEESINRIKGNIPEEHQSNLYLIKSRFEHLNWNSMPMFDVVVAINSISFVNHEDFDTVWNNIKTHTKPNGLIIARLFGNKTDWPNTRGMTLLSREDLTSLTSGLEIVKLQEELLKDKAITQHAYNLILRNKQQN